MDFDALALDLNQTIYPCGDIDWDFSTDEKEENPSNHKSTSFSGVMSLFAVIYLCRIRKKTLRPLLTNYLNMIHSSQFRCIKKYNRIINKNQLRQKKRPLPKPVPLTLASFDIYSETGVMEDEFEWIYKQLESRLVFSRYNQNRKAKHKLVPRLRMIMILNYLREHPKFRLLAQKFQISPALAHRDIRYLLPKLYVVLQGQIKWPQELQIGWEGVSGAIDCTNHPRTRVHPWQANFFRRDKGFMILGQVVCGLEGQIYQVDLLSGHNNDAGALIITNMKEFLVTHQIKLLADSSYHHHLLETPNNNMSNERNNTQKSLRSVVEAVIGQVRIGE
jgi:hypothetical protein